MYTYTYLYRCICYKDYQECEKVNNRVIVWICQIGGNENEREKKANEGLTK
jgi:hypothetical protein